MINLKNSGKIVYFSPLSSIINIFQFNTFGEQEIYFY